MASSLLPRAIYNQSGLSAAIMWLLALPFIVAWFLLKMAYRFASGLPMDGEHRTNAGFLEPGTEALTPNGRASKWAFLPQAHRAGIRLAVTAVTLGTWYGLEVAPVATIAVWSLAVIAAGVYAYRRARHAILLREHRRTYVVPMGHALGGFLGKGDASAAPGEIERWLKIPLDFFTGESRPEMTVALSSSVAYDDKVKTAALKLIADKLGKGLDDLDYQWHGMGANPYISLRLAPKPPNAVTFADLKPLMEKAKESSPVMGVAARNKVISSDFDTEAPHVAASCAPGAGKSIWGRLLIAQGLRNGTQYAILDKKRVSQGWCREMPGVTYCVEGHEMHDTLLGLEVELKRRYQIIDAAEDPDNADVGPRIVLFFEEQNIGMKALKKYWVNTRDKSDPKRSPALDALDELLCAGRQAKMHVISIAQLFTVQASGGDPVARESYSTRLLARATAGAWKMLAPECAPFPKINRKPGRFNFVADGVATEFQVGYLTEDEAREWAQGGHVTVPAQWGVASGQSRDAVTDPNVTASGERLYSLAEASREGLVGDLTPEALRQRKLRSGDRFPAGQMVGKREKWTEAQLTEWYQAMVLVQSATDERDSE